MSSSLPIIKQTNWLSLFPHLLVMGILMAIAIWISPKQGMLVGPLLYLLLSFGLRYLIPKDHRKGMANIKSGDYSGAINDFEKSYAFFTQNMWIDKNRFITLLSSSKISYREMALANIAFSHAQLGNGDISKAFYKRALEEFPESAIAKAALKMIASFKNEKDSKHDES